MLLLLSFNILLAGIFAAPVQIGYVYKNETGKYQVIITNDTTSTTPEYYSRITFSNSVNETGWAFIEVKTNSSVGDNEQAYTAGYAEGFVTAELIYMHWYNTMYGFCDNRQVLCDKVQQHIVTNMRWVNKMITKHGSTSAYWHQVELVYRQLRGLYDGYNFAMVNDSSRQLSYNDLLWLNIQGDLEDLMEAIDTTGYFKQPMAVRGRTVAGAGSCSALIKLLPDFSDLYVAQDTWSSLQSMLRALKKYDFGFRKVETSETLIPGMSMSFSSYPGIILSNDDFYITSEGLVIQETTIGNSNSSLWVHVKPIGQVLEFVRAIVANRLATSGRTWSKLFSVYNSGTYNNQWMIVDYKLFKPGTEQKLLKDDLLWVLEQIPGYIQAADKTDVLRKQSYWPSYNAAYFPDIYNMSGVPALVKQYGDWFTYDQTPRALIFKRDHHKVNDTDSMLALMRYNDYKHDPLARCDCIPPYSGENAIACRSDLNPANGTYPFGALGHRPHVATDAKVTSMNMASRLEFIAVSGPVHNENIPVFQWSKSDYESSSPHLGHPDLWEFKPIVHSWS